MNIQDKVAVITGGASGLGKACAVRLLACGARVAVLDFNQQALTSASEALDVKGYQCDVSQADQVERVIAAIVEDCGAIHLGINCAGIVTGARMVGRNGPMPLADFERIIQVNLIGTFNVMRLMAAVMMQQEPVDSNGERGVIINTASVAAYEGQIGQSAYSASKGGVVAMTLPIAREMSQFGIRVMTIAPGIMQTPMMDGMPPEVQDSLNASVPFPKRMGTADEYADLAQHIIENSYLNGSVIRLDGAIRMQAK